MQTSNDSTDIKVNRRSTQSSTTLSRRYTKRPKMGNEVKVNIKKSSKVSHFAMEEPMKPVEATESVAPMEPVEPIEPAVRPVVIEKSVKAPTTPKRVSGQKMKEQAIKKALASASKVNGTKVKMPKKKVTSQIHFGMGRIVLALACSVAVVAGIVYLVNQSMPDLSMQVAAMQNGINPTYPGYIPKDYKVSGIVSAEGKITINFTNSSLGKDFSLIEEKSSWNTDALLNNYVKVEYADDYTIVREQGLTIYVSGSDAAWVNGGNVYKIIAKSDTLTNKQIRSIAASL